MESGFTLFPLPSSLVPAVMAGVAIKILTAEAIRRLAGLEARGENLSGVMRSFGAYMQGSIQKNFDAEGRPVRWAPLRFATKIAWHTKRASYWNKKGTAMSKKGRAAWGGRKILTVSGRLRRSIKTTTMPNGIMIGSNTIYAAIHQFGGQAGRGHKVMIPARPYLLFQGEDVAIFGKMLTQYLMTGNLS